MKITLNDAGLYRINGITNHYDKGAVVEIDHLWELMSITVMKKFKLRIRTKAGAYIIDSDVDKVHDGLISTSPKSRLKLVRRWPFIISEWYYEIELKYDD